jgi:hypothetical protein
VADHPQLQRKELRLHATLHLGEVYLQAGLTEPSRHRVVRACGEVRNF